VTEHPDGRDDASDEAEHIDDGAGAASAFGLVWRCREINCANIVHEHKQRKNPPFPTLAFLAFVGVQTTRKVHTRVLSQIIRDMGVFMRRPPSVTEITVELRGIDIPDMNLGDSLWTTIGEFAHDIGAVFDPTELIAILRAKDDEWADVQL